jgi:hypothetical protein
MQREDERLKNMQEGEITPLLYFYSDIKCAAVSGRWISLIPEKTR